jgi:murein DD-endopeptidase MepM/ murein hydrolase activator NlpD
VPEPSPEPALEPAPEPSPATVVAAAAADASLPTPSTAAQPPPPDPSPRPSQPQPQPQQQQPVTTGVPPVGIGRRFQPLPEAQLVSTARAGGVARLPTAPGTPVHSIAAATIVSVDGAGGLAAQDRDGRRYRYQGLAPGSVTVSVGSQVRAGDILGSVAGDALEVGLTDPGGQPVDAIDALVGLPDPNELGYAAVGVGLGIDPDALDREAAGDLRGMAEPR